MKWNHAIILVMALFMTFILSFIFRAAGLNTELYAADYYEQELDYQNTIDALTNAKEFQTSFTSTVIEKDLVLNLPEKSVSGASSYKITLYRPNDSSLDMSFDTEQELALIPIDKVHKGYYEMSVFWKKDNKNYLIKKPLTIN